MQTLRKLPERLLALVVLWAPFIAAKGQPRGTCKLISDALHATTIDGPEAP